MEQGSEHPVGKALVAAAIMELGELPAVAAFVSSPGLGVQETVDGRPVWVGRAALGLADLSAGPAPVELQS